MLSMREVLRTKDLTLHAPPEALYKSEHAFYFPELEVLPLAGGTARIAPDGLLAGRRTLIGCSGSNFAQPMVDGWLDGVASLVEEEGPSQRPQLLWLSLVENKLVSFFQRPLMASMRLSVPRERHSSFLCYFGDTAAARKRMRMQSRYLGYVCLADEKGVVRWHVHGNEPPTEAALASLRDLLRRAD